MTDSTHGSPLGAQIGPSVGDTPYMLRVFLLVAVAVSDPLDAAASKPFLSFSGSLSTTSAFRPRHVVQAHVMGYTRRSRAERPSMVAAAPAPRGTSATSMTVNLAKNIVGAGVLALAAGVSTFSSSSAAIVPALAVLLFLAAISGYTFSLIARLGAEVGTESYRATWAKIFGERSALLPAATVTFKTVVGALSYAIIIGDSFSSIAKLCGAPALLCRSNAWIVIMSTFVLLPLCLLRDLSSLAIGSYLGTGVSSDSTLLKSPSHVAIPRRHPKSPTQVPIPRRHPTLPSHVAIPSRQPRLPSQVSIPSRHTKSPTLASAHPVWYFALDSVWLEFGHSNTAALPQANTNLPPTQFDPPSWQAVPSSPLASCGVAFCKDPTLHPVHPTA